MYVPPVRPKRNIFCTWGEYVTMSNGVFNFNFLALLLSEILEGSQIYIRGPCAPQKPPSGKILSCAQLLAYIYTIVNFQLRSSIHAGLMERSLYNRFALKNLPKWGFWGEGLRYLVGTPLGMQCPPIYVVWWKNYGDAPNTLVCTLGKDITKKTGMSTPWGLHFTPVQRLPP